jgi:hypothetical protein
MESFLKSLKALTQQIQSNKALEPFAFDLIQLIDLSEETLSQLK